VVRVADTPTETEPFDLWGSISFPDLGSAFTSLDYVRGRGIDDATLKGQAVSQWNGGAQVIQWFGHGSTDRWGLFPAFFDRTDAMALSNQSRLPLVVVASCLNALIHYPFLPSLAEGLLENPAGGAIALVGPSTLDRGVFEQYMLAFFYEQLYCRGLPVGEALRQAKTALAGLGNDLLDTVRGYTLIGDPALRLR
jgi:hypothetical protein